MLDFIKRDFPEYAWRIAALDRRVRQFGLRHIDYTTLIEAVSGLRLPRIK